VGKHESGAQLEFFGDSSKKIDLYQVQLENWSFSSGKTPLLDLDKV
jgi:hypothetical protein